MHGMQIRAMLLFLVLVQLADAVTFALGVDLHGIGLESNGFAVAAYHWAGVNGVLLMKLGVILAVLGILVYASQRFPRLLVWGAAAATAMGLLGVLTNVGSLLIMAS